MKLNDSLGLYLGTLAANAVYVGDHKIWPPAPPTYIFNDFYNPSLESGTFNGFGGATDGRARSIVSGGLFGNNCMRLTSVAYGLLNGSRRSDLYQTTVNVPKTDWQVGDVYTASVWVRTPESGWEADCYFTINSEVRSPSYTPLVPNEWTRVWVTTTVPAGGTTYRFGAHVRRTGGGTIPVGQYVEQDGFMVNKGELIDYFDGSLTSDDPNIAYSWLGEPHNSQSIARIGPPPPPPPKLPPIDGGAALARAQTAQTTQIKEDWSSWGGIDSNGWMYDSGSLMSNIPGRVVGGFTQPVNLTQGERYMMRVEVEFNSSGAGRSFLLGVSNAPTGLGPPTPDPNGVYFGISGSSAPGYFTYKGANVSGSYSETGGAGGVGSYLVTLVVDEDYITLSVQKRDSNQNDIKTISVPRSAMPNVNGAGVNGINHVAFMCNDTVARSSLTVGPVFAWKELQVPFDEDKTINGINLWGSGNPMMIVRNSPTTNILHMYRVTGSYSPDNPMPMTQWHHHALSGDATDPFLDNRITPLTPSLENWGYSIASTDNGIGGALDRGISDGGIADYEENLNWYRDRFTSAGVILYGASGGGYPIWRMVFDGRIPHIMAVIGMSIGYDLQQAYNNAQFKGIIDTELGTTNWSQVYDYLSSRNIYAPEEPAARFGDMPKLLIYSNNDTVVPHTNHHIPLYDKLVAGGVPVEELFYSGAGHMTAPMFNPVPIKAFLDGHRIPTRQT